MRRIPPTDGESFEDWPYADDDPDDDPDDGDAAALGDPRAEPWWDTLTLTERIEHEVAEVFSVLASILTEVRTKEGRRLRWMETSLACALADVDRIVRKLTGERDP